MTLICPDNTTSTVHLLQPFHIFRLSPACNTTSRYFHLHPHYEDHTIMMYVSLDTANINTINISILDFRIQQHFSSNWTPPHLQKLPNVSEMPVTQLYRDMINTSEPIHSFTIKDDDEDPSFICSLNTSWDIHRDQCISFAVCIGVWIRPVTSRNWPCSPVSSQHVTVDDDVKGVPI